MNTSRIRIDTPFTARSGVRGRAIQDWRSASATSSAVAPAAFNTEGAVRCLIRQPGVAYPFVARVARANERPEVLIDSDQGRPAPSLQVSIAIAPSVVEPFERDFLPRIREVLWKRPQVPHPLWGGWRVSQVPGALFLWPPGARVPHRLEGAPTVARVLAEAAACGRRPPLPDLTAPS